MVTRQENAQKLVYLAKQYPEHTLDKIVALFQLPPIDINVAVWTAVEYGLITKPDAKTSKVEILKRAEQLYMGDDVHELMSKLIYCFRQLGDQENDIEENYLSVWTQGYPSHDVLIAIHRLIEDGALASYQIEDDENTYTFYTLATNIDKQWGLKQFKKAPKKRSPKKGKKITVNNDNKSDGKIRVKKG